MTKHTAWNINSCAACKPRLDQLEEDQGTEIDMIAAEHQAFVHKAAKCHADLLAALQELVSLVEAAYIDPESLDAYNDARQAIRKAQGGA